MPARLAVPFDSNSLGSLSVIAVDAHPQMLDNKINDTFPFEFLVLNSVPKLQSLARRNLFRPAEPKVPTIQMETTSSREQVAFFQNVRYRLECVVAYKGHGRDN